MRPSQHSLFTLVFFASGFAGLIYESIWSHYLKLFLGHAAYAQTLVLAIFMGGMALGAAAAGRALRRLGNPLRAYALTEGAIGVLALAFHPVFVESTEGLYRLAESGALGAAAFAAAKWSLAVALILPAATLLGATFPLFAAGLARHARGREGHTFATLYFVNSLGGAIGVLASGFWAIPALGLPGTIALAGACNLAIAAVSAWAAAGTGRATPAPDDRAPFALDRLTALLLAVAFVTGASSFVYEVGWIRMLSLVLGSATHSFELMLSAFILGLALGGLWVRRRIDDHANVGALLGQVQVVMGLCALATLPLYAASFEFIGWLVSAAPRTDRGYLLLNLGRYGVSAAVMMPAAFCAGMTLPLATRLLFGHRRHGERAIGAIYSANTLGAIAGVAFAIHVGLPVLGLRHVVALGAAIDVLLGLWLLGVFARPRAMPYAGVALAGSVAGALLIRAGFDPQQLASGVYRSGQSRIDNTVLAMADGKTATVSVDRDAAGAIAIRTNGKADASAYVDRGGAYRTDEVTMALIPALPLAIHAAPARIANIGFGSGITAHTLLSDPRVAAVDSIEIEPRMVELARYFRPLNASAYDDPRSAVHYDDAKSYFAARRQRYDMIVSEPSNPWVSGVASLFSIEFYRHVQRYLADDGLFVQWIQVYETHPDRVVSVLKAMDAVFGDYLLFGANHGDLVLVAKRRGPLALPADALERLAPATRRLVDRLEVRSNGDFTVRLIGDKALLGPWLKARDVPANSDFRPFLDTHADRDRFVGGGWPASHIEGELSPNLLPQLLGGRPSFETPADITLNTHFGDQAPALAAQRVFERLLGLPMRVPAHPVARVVEAAAADLLAACRQPPNGDAPYAMVRIAGTVLPYLSAEQGRVLLERLRGQACLQMPGAAGDAWRELLARVAARDPALARSADALLQAGEGRTPVRARFLLGLALAGHLAAGDRAGARAAWARHGEAVAPPAQRNLALQILVAHLDGDARGTAAARPRRRPAPRRRGAGRDGKRFIPSTSPLRRAAHVRCESRWRGGACPRIRTRCRTRCGGPPRSRGARAGCRDRTRARPARSTPRPARRPPA